MATKMKKMSPEEIRSNNTASLRKNSTIAANAFRTDSPTFEETVLIGETLAQFTDLDDEDIVAYIHEALDYRDKHALSLDIGGIIALAMVDIEEAHTVAMEFFKVSDPTTEMVVGVGGLLANDIFDGDIKLVLKVLKEADVFARENFGAVTHEDIIAVAEILAEDDDAEKHLKAAKDVANGFGWTSADDVVSTYFEIYGDAE